MSAATQVSLSSGETFYVDANLEEVKLALNKTGLRRIGRRFVACEQVAQLISVPDYPSIHIPERLEN